MNPDDLKRVEFRGTRPQGWTLLWNDVLGFYSCGAVIASGLQFAYASRHVLFGEQTTIAVLWWLGLAGFALGLAGIIRGALHRQFAIVSLLGLISSCAPLFVTVLVISFAAMH